MSKHLNEEYLQNLLGLLRGFTPHTPITEDDIENVFLTIRDSFDGEQMPINRIAGETYQTLSVSDKENLKKAVPSQFVRTILKSMYDNYEKVVNAQLSKVKSQFDYLLKGLER